jgi:DNA-binding transcriptional MerR regulator
LTPVTTFTVEPMLIGELAERAGTSTRTLRYYEQHGLVHARRSPNGYRVYDETELRVVHEIRTLLAVGFGLDDIRPFVDCLRAGNRSGDVCPDSVAVLRRKLAEVDAVIERMSAVRDQLRMQLVAAVAQRAQNVQRAQHNQKSQHAPNAQEAQREERRCAPSPTTRSPKR